jgi:hypothetical protein
MNFLTDDEKYRLAVFLKRINFNMAYECSDCDTHEEMKAQAYRTLEIVGKVQTELSRMGFSPR